MKDQSFAKVSDNNPHLQHKTWREWAADHYIGDWTKYIPVIVLAGLLGLSIACNVLQASRNNRLEKENEFLQALAERQDASIQTASKTLIEFRTILNKQNAVIEEYNRRFSR